MYNSLPPDILPSLGFLAHMVKILNSHRRYEEIQVSYKNSEENIKKKRELLKVGAGMRFT